MTELSIASLLSASRSAHVQGRSLSAKKQYAAARESFRKAKEQRDLARKTDPGKTDPSWAEDLKALHSRKELEAFLNMRLAKAENAPDPEGYDVAATRLVDVEGLTAELERTDKELDAYYRHQLGEDLNAHQTTALADAAQVVTPPDEWRTAKAGSTPCATCQHPEASHAKGPCAESAFKDGDVRRCACKEYVASACVHTWIFEAVDSRQCAGCGEVQHLQPTIALEDTAAYKQLQRESQRKQ